MAQEIRWLPGPDWSQQASLDGRVYQLRARYSVTSGRWLLDIRSRNGTPLVLGIRLVRGDALLRLHPDPRLPPGELFIAGSADPNRENLGTDSRLIYLTADEVANAV
jgi:hypothetical protein